MPLSSLSADLDGYPDLVIPMDLGLQLWHSRACDGASCATAAVSTSRRTFAPDFSSAAIRALQNVESAAFMDLGEKVPTRLYPKSRHLVSIASCIAILHRIFTMLSQGSLDLLVVTKPPNGPSRPATVYNNLVLDAFFLKVRSQSFGFFAITSQCRLSG